MFFYDKVPTVLIQEFETSKIWENSVSPNYDPNEHPLIDFFIPKRELIKILDKTEWGIPTVTFSEDVKPDYTFLTMIFVNRKYFEIEKNVFQLVLKGDKKDNWVVIVEDKAVFNFHNNDVVRDFISFLNLKKGIIILNVVTRGDKIFDVSSIDPPVFIKRFIVDKIIPTLIKKENLNLLPFS